MQKNALKFYVHRRNAALADQQVTVMRTKAGEPVRPGGSNKLQQIVQHIFQQDNNKEKSNKIYKINFNY